MKIRELAQQAACGVETVRYYERAGLLPPPARSAGNYRQYGAAHLARLQFIRRCRSLDMSHDEVRILLAMQDKPDAGCEAVNACVDAHIAHVEHRLAELSALRDDLLGLRQRCAQAGAVSECGILGALHEEVFSLGGSRGATTHAGASACSACHAKADSP